MNTISGMLLVAICMSFCLEVIIPVSHAAGFRQEIPPESIPEAIEILASGIQEPSATKYLVYDVGESAIQPILAAIKEDQRFETNENARANAFRVLGYLGNRDSGSLVLRNSEQISALVRGCTDRSAQVRMHCVTTLNAVDQSHQSVAISGLVVSLADSDVDIGATAAQSLGIIGPAAEKALVALNEILEFPLSLKERVDAFANNSVEAAIRAERVFRASAALARVQIGGVTIDLERYAQLDPVGVEAGVGALQFSLRRALYDHARNQSELPASSIEVFANYGMIIDLIASFCLNAEQPEKKKIKSLKCLGRALLSSATPAEQRQTIMATIDAAQLATDSQVAEAADRVQEFVAGLGMWY